MGLWQTGKWVLTSWRGALDSTGDGEVGPPGPSDEWSCIARVTPPSALKVTQPRRAVTLYLMGLEDCPPFTQHGFGSGGRLGAL